MTFPYKLARFVDHDPLSRNFAIEEPTDEEIAALVSVRHERYVPVFNQGEVGSCTANAAVGALGTGAFWPAVGESVLTQNPDVDEQYALGCYSDEEVALGFGPYPPNDNGGSGLAIAKVLKKRGLIPAYQHAFSLNATLAALAKQPVIIGINWYDLMENTTPEGQVSPVGSVVGGHEIVLDEIDVENKRVWFTNSWSDSWGIQGRGWMIWSDLGALLGQNGDCTVFTVPVPAPAPSPTPQPEPVPAPTPEPTPTPAPVGPTAEGVLQIVESGIKAIESVVEQVKTDVENYMSEVKPESLF
jgi:hypothetical protein